VLARFGEHLPALRRAALEPMWKRDLDRVREPGQQPELPLLTEELVLPTE